MNKQRKIGTVSQITALRAGFGICLYAVYPMASASAQTQPSSDANTPVAARIAPSLELKEGLPNNLQPEEISSVKGELVGPNRLDQPKPRPRNRWDPSTLTQTTGLSAHSFVKQAEAQPYEEVETSSPMIATMATDLLSAEDLLNVDKVMMPQASAALASPPQGEGVVNLSSTLRGALFDLPTSDNVNASVFTLNVGGRLCLGTAQDCRANELPSIDVGYAKNITSGKYDGLNLQLTPRAGVRIHEESKSALVGALVRIGDNLREGSEMKSNTWYFFAGAEAEAVTYTPNSARRLTSGEFHLQNRIIVGDAQAGLGYKLGTADLALTYFKRQATAENYKFNEDAAALSITWKR